MKDKSEEILLAMLEAYDDVYKFILENKQMVKLELLNFIFKRMEEIKAQK